MRHLAQSMSRPRPAHTAAAPLLSNGNPRGRRGFLKTGAATAAGLMIGCDRKSSPSPPVVVSPALPAVPADPVPPPLPPPDAPPPPVKLWNLSELAPPPDWSRLDAWQETITAADFRHLLENVLTDGNAHWSTVEQREDRAIIRRSTAREGAERFELRFAGKPASAVLALPPAAPSPAFPPPAARYWRKASEMGPVTSQDRPLEGVRIALDAGHIGGQWAKMEGRWYQIGESLPVMEGEMTLRTARLLRPLLEALGAEVSMVRYTTAPLTTQQPDTLHAEALKSLTAAKGAGNAFTDIQIRREAERLFYRTSEIRARGQRVNEVLRPDLLVCLHFNAESWGSDDGKPVFSKANHLHVLAHGCLSAAEFSLDDQRLDGLLRIVQGIPHEEIRLCDAVARHLATATGLRPFTYSGKSACRVNNNPYLWARNLLANRVYHCPVVFTEPYVMNHQEVFDRIQCGDYDGEKVVAGKLRRSIYREYAQAVADGLAEAVAAGRG